MNTVRLNADEELVHQIRSAMAENGGHCPCKIDKTPDTICMCREFRTQITEGYEGLCHCGLYETYPISEQQEVDCNATTKSD